jgi:hypothetical protein
MNISNEAYGNCDSVTMVQLEQFFCLTDKNKFESEM